MKGELEDAKKRPKEWTARAGLFDALAQLSLAKASEKAMASLANEACACLAAVCKAGGTSQLNLRCFCYCNHPIHTTYPTKSAHRQVETWTSVSPWCKGEAQKDAKEKLTAALGTWLAFVPGPLPKETVDIVIAGIKDTKAGRLLRISTRPTLNLLPPPRV